MNTLKNLNKKVLFVLMIVAIVAIRCANADRGVSKVQFIVSPMVDSLNNKIKLKLSFLSSIDDSMIFDRNVFSVFNPNLENWKISPTDTNQSMNIDSLNYSQCIVENKQKVRRFFSNINLFDNEVVEGKSVLSFESNYDTLYLVANSAVSLSLDPIDINRFKNTFTDDTIRITYIFKPTNQQLSSGFKARVLTSNWFSVK